MPHQCTNCERTFGEGSTDMLSGCPSCGGNRFQYLPEGEVEPTPSPQQDAAASETEDTGSGLLRSLMDRGANVADGNLIEAEPDPDYDPEESLWPPEDRAQNDARSGMVDPDELPQQAATETEPSPEEETVERERDPADRPDLDELREELQDRFGSIKIVDRGEYELNLMELYERKECIIELQENGRYAIQVPETLSGETPSSDVANQ